MESCLLNKHGILGSYWDKWKNGNYYIRIGYIQGLRVRDSFVLILQSCVNGRADRPGHLGSRGSIQTFLHSFTDPMQ